jgi:NaMN:DMB phosphoribosyltransferase
MPRHHHSSAQLPRLAQVTPAIFRAIAAGKAASSVLCAAHGCQLHLLDVGVDADLESVAPGAPHIQVGAVGCEEWLACDDGLPAMMDCLR